MAVSAWFVKCPACRSANIQEIGRVESDENNPTDYAIYCCYECGAEFDEHTNKPDVRAKA